MALNLLSFFLFAFSAGVGGECEDEEDDDVEVSVDGVAVSPWLADGVGAAFSDTPPFTEFPDVILSVTVVEVEF